MKIFQIIFIILICVFLSVVSNAQIDSIKSNDTILMRSDPLIVDSSIANADSVAGYSKLTLVFGGDIMGHDTQITGAWDDSCKSYNYEPTFRYISDYISAADLAIGNLEVTLAGKPYKGYPEFSSPDELAVAAKDAGFDILVNANNHALDRGARGLNRTQQVLDSLEILHTGTFVSDSQRFMYYPLIVEKNNIRIALLNYTYGTNGLKVDTPYSVNYIDTALIRKDLQKARKANPDFVIVITHWGIEYERSENKIQDKQARFILDNGADAIIGSHPHVVQPIKYITLRKDSLRSYPVYYSMGNFVSNQRAQYKDGGIMAEMHFVKKDSITRIDSLAWLPYWVYRKDFGEKSIFYVIPVSKYETDTTIVNFNSSDSWRFRRFARDTRELLKDSPVKESGFYNKPEEILAGD